MRGLRCASLTETFVFNWTTSWRYSYSIWRSWNHSYVIHSNRWCQWGTASLDAKAVSAHDFTVVGRDALSLFVLQSTLARHRAFPEISQS